MKTARLFRMIWRVNGVLLLLAFLLLGGVALVAMLSSVTRGRRTNKDPAVAVAEKGQRLFIGSVEEVEGTSFVLLPLESRQAYSKFSSGSSQGREARNLLFYDAAKGAAHWLRPNHKAVIVNHELLREGGAVLQRRGSKKEETSDPVRWIRYELATADTNHDGEITEEDARQIAISGPGGEGFTEIVNGVDEILGYTSPRDGTLIVLFRRGEDNFAGEIDLVGRKLRRTVPLPKS